MHITKPMTVATFKEFGKEAIFAFIKAELCKVKRVDMVWHQYLDYNIQRNRNRVRRKQTKTPIRWHAFLRVAKNKVQLFTFLNDVAESTSPEHRNTSNVTRLSCVHWRVCTYVLVILIEQFTILKKNT